MDLKTLMEQNIWKMLCIAGFRQMIIWTGFAVPFFTQNGLTMNDIFWLEVVFSAILVLADVPTGAISDKYGRKPCLIIGFIFIVMGMLVYVYTGSFWPFLIAESLIGIGMSFLSGTLQAITVESLEYLGRSHERRQWVCRQNMAAALSQAFGGLIAAAIVCKFPLRDAVMWGMIPPLCGLVMSFFVKEPPRHTSKHSTYSMIWKTLKKVFHRHTIMRTVALLHAVLNTMTLMLFWFSQPYQELIGVPLVWYGVIHFTVNVCAATGSWALYKHIRLGDKSILASMGFIVVICYIFVATCTHVSCLVFVVLGRAILGIVLPLTSEIQTRLSGKEVIATVQSIQSGSARLLFAIVSISMATAFSQVPLQQRILGMGIGGAILLACIFASSSRLWDDIPQPQKAETAI